MSRESDNVRARGVLTAHAEFQERMLLRRFPGTSLALVLTELHQRRITGTVTVTLNLSQGAVASFVVQEKES